MVPLQVQSPSGGGDLVIVGGDNHTGALTSLSLGITARSGAGGQRLGIILRLVRDRARTIEGRHHQRRPDADARGQHGRGHGQTLRARSYRQTQFAGRRLRIGGDPTVNSTAILDIGLTSGSNANPYIQGVSSSGNTYGVTIINPMGGRTQVGPSAIQDPTSSLFVHQDPSSSRCAAFSDKSGSYYMTVGDGSYALKVFGEAYRNNGSPFWNTTSDECLKTEIETLGSALSLVNRIRPVTFRYSAAHRAANPGTPSTQQYGVVAQEFAKVFPDFVSTNQDGFLSVNSSPLVFANTAAIQELHTQVKDRDDRIHQLESRVDELQQDVTRLKAARDSVAALLTDQLQAMQKQLAVVACAANVRIVSNP